MTSVHGEPQQGGYLPAEIWHSYMSRVVEGKTCQSFPAAKESLSYQPFYGKFATTGQSESFSEEHSNEERAAPKSKSRERKSERGGTGGPSAPAKTEKAPAEPRGEPPVKETGGAAPR
jgi:membrane carboxypeptidase/penicillin-binding protein